MNFQQPAYLHIESRAPSRREEVLVVTEDPDFWMALRQAAPDLDSCWARAHTAREALGAAEDQRIRLVVIDGSLRDRPADQLLQLLKKIRPTLAIVFAFGPASAEREMEVRQAGILYYGDRNLVEDIVHVVRQSVRKGNGPMRARARAGGSMAAGEDA